jgi:hypothetical protein
MTPPSSPQPLVDRFGQVLDHFPQARRRKMFGFPAAFVGGNLATGLYGDGWMVRLGPEADRLVERGAAAPFEPMAGRTMRGYVLLPAEVVANDAELLDWVGRALAYAGTLPSKG